MIRQILLRRGDSISRRKSFLSENTVTGDTRKRQVRFLNTSFFLFFEILGFLPWSINVSSATKLILSEIFILWHWISNYFTKMLTFARLLNRQEICRWKQFPFRGHLLWINLNLFFRFHLLFIEDFYLCIQETRRQILCLLWTLFSLHYAFTLIFTLSCAMLW